MPLTTPRNSSCYAYSSKTSESPAGTSKSDSASHWTRHHHSRPAQHPQQETRHHYAQCQPKTVCVPLVVTSGESYRMRHADHRKGAAKN